MIECKICKRSTEKVNKDFEDLCEPCGERTRRVMYGIYILTRGKPDVPFKHEEVMNFIKYKKTKELYDLVGEIKKVKWLKGEQG